MILKDSILDFNNQLIALQADSNMHAHVATQQNENNVSHSSVMNISTARRDSSPDKSDKAKSHLILVR